MSVDSQPDRIESREDFIAFVRALSKDFHDNNDDWENVTVASFLDALAAWTESMDGYYANLGELPPTNINWKLIAQLLLAAKIYE